MEASVPDQITLTCRWCVHLVAAEFSVITEWCARKFDLLKTLNAMTIRIVESNYDFN